MIKSLLETGLFSTFKYVGITYDNTEDSVYINEYFRKVYESKLLTIPEIERLAVNIINYQIENKLMTGKDFRELFKKSKQLKNKDFSKIDEFCSNEVKEWNALLEELNHEKKHWAIRYVYG